MNMAHWKAILVASLATAAHTIENFPTENALTLLGPVYQATTNSTWPQYADAVSQAHDALAQAIATGDSGYGAIDNESTSFSIAVFSATDNSTIFDFHFEAPQLNGSYTAGKLTDNTIYRTGSIGKLLTIYAWLVDIGDSVFLDPVTKYIVCACSSIHAFGEGLALTIGTARACSSRCHSTTKSNLVHKLGGSHNRFSGFSNIRHRP